MRDQDVVAIARAMGYEVKPFVLISGEKSMEWRLVSEEESRNSYTLVYWRQRESDGEFYHVYDYATPEGAFKILDYIRENPQTDFCDQFIHRLYGLLPNLSCLISHTDVLWVTILTLTPSLIKQVAYEAAKECVE